MAERIMGEAIAFLQACALNPPDNAKAGGAAHLSDTTADTTTALLGHRSRKPVFE